MSGIAEKFAHHLKLDDTKIAGARFALLPGDPGRVPIIAAGLSDSHEISFSREFRTFLGYLNQVPVLVTSTGIGGPSVSVCVEELARLGVHSFIRVGSCGAIQENIHVGDTVITHAAVRLDGASRSFAPLEYPAVADFELTEALVYAAKALGLRYHIGITASTDTFYQGQERYDTFTGFVPAHLRGSMKDWRAMHVSNFEMEAATLLTMCATMGLRAGCICGVVAKRVVSESIAEEAVFRQAEQNGIKVAVEAVKKLIEQA
jgi:uridine phosphorylase